MSVHPLLQILIKDFSLSGDLPRDAMVFLHQNDCPNTATHSRKVAKAAMKLAAVFGGKTAEAKAAAWLHDISAVVPNPERLAVSKQLDIPILPAEEEAPLLLHQKISAVIAEQIFGIRSRPVLDAIACHTTLKAQPAQLDLVLFVSDKLAWDQQARPPYADKLEAALTRSLEEAAWVYQDYLLTSGKIRIIHPWMQASCDELRAKFSPQT